jgi:hypothetical protein
MTEARGSSCGLFILFGAHIFIQNHWLSGLCPITRNSKKLENITFRKMDLFPSSDGGRETSTPLGRFERANQNPWASY